MGEERARAYLETLHKLAEVSVDAGKAFRLYTRSAESVYKQARIYRAEGDLEKAFILFLKYSNLILKELPKHPDYKNNGATMAPLRGNLVQVLDILEASKPMLLARFREAEAERARLESRQQEMLAARKREEDARRLAERAVKGQEEARKQRILEMQKLDLANRLATKSADLSASLSGEISTPVLTPSPAPSGASAVAVAVSPPPVPVILPDARPAAKPQFFLENGMPLRKVLIPQCIIQQFLKVAAVNTRSNLETCGVLAGKLAHDVFTITTLVIPKQTSTSDTVAMLNEEEIFDVQDSRELLTLGWIHTHPTQKCFMSSVDLHTHFPYQLLMAEAIAIVVAPTQSPNYGIFRLTDPPGIGTISKCPQRGFHHHGASDGSIYREISGPAGHAKFDSLPLDIVDLRNK